MKYMIQAMVSADRIADVVQALFTDIDYDPELKVYWRPETRAPKEPPKERRVIVPIPVTVEKPKRKSPTVVPSGTRAAILEAALKTGPKRWSEMKTALSAGGLSESSLNNMVGNWKKEGKIQRSEDGLWSLVEPNAKAQA